MRGPVLHFLIPSIKILRQSFLYIIAFVVNTKPSRSVIRKIMNSEKPPPKNIIIGQRISRQKAALAREFRRNMTQSEKSLWQLLRANRLDGWHFRRQQVIAGFIVDFYCHKAGLVVELDGEVHSNQIDYDLERDRILSDLGIRVLRITNRAVEDNRDLVLHDILAACNSLED